MSNESVYKGNETRESAADLLRRTREVVKKIAEEDTEELEETDE